MEYVVDTSALLAVASEQPEKAALLRLTRGCSLVAPSSVRWEVGNAISAMFKRRQVTLEQGIAIEQACASVPIRTVDIELAEAIRLSFRLNIYAYDAYVLGCALVMRSPILTLDRGLTAHAKTLGIETPEIVV